METNVLEHIQLNQSGKFSKDPKKLLHWIVDNLPNKKVIMGTGFGPPGIVLLDMLFKVSNNISVFYIDTDYLFDQTYDLKSKLESRYNFKFLKFNSNISPIEQEKSYGKKLWEKDPDACCNIRKVLPLKEALQNYDIWITGIRKKQTAVRKSSNLIEFESRFEVIKINPLINWTHKEVWNYIKENNLPYNTLHDSNYPSIGCKQCTNPVLPGEDDRSGRWKGKNKTECGLHCDKTISLNK